MPQFPLQTTTTLGTSFGTELIQKTATYWWKAPTQFITNFQQLCESTPLLITEEVFHTYESSCPTVLVLSERRQNQTQPSQRRELTGRMGGKTVASFLSLWPPQGTGSPTSPPSTANPAVFWYQAASTGTQGLR